MKECIEDCLNCSNSFSIPSENNDYDKLYCSEKEKIVNEDECCDDYN